MRLRQQLLTAAAAFGAATGRPETAVSRLLFGSGNRLSGIRAGRGILSDGAEDALQRLSDEWPEGAAWPEKVPRPVPAALRPDGAEPDADDGAASAPRRRRRSPVVARSSAPPGH